VLYTGAKPVFLEASKETWCLDPRDIEKKITKKTKAIIPVHLYGHPADMKSILEIAKKYKLHVIEDAAEAHGALYNGKKVGGFGEISCFSFFGNKTITMGEGGIVVTNDKKLADRVKYLRDGARDRTVNKYFHTELGYNYALTNLQAAVGLAQLERIDKFISKKREIARIYRKEFGNYDKVVFSPEEKGIRNTYWMSSIILTKKNKVARDFLIGELSKVGIETRPFFDPIYSLPYINQHIKLPIVDYLAGNGLNLPSGVKLTEKDIIFIVKEIKRILGK
jgi:perosamine synthetase